jgi:hypothetical protein
MIDQNKPPNSGRAINVGIYGCTKAGKTRFLFQLLSHWERARRLLSPSDKCQKFLETVEREIETYDVSMPTVATTEGIKLKLRRDGNEAPLELVFRDLRGELLSAELDQIDKLNLNRNGTIPTQVQQCDAFLFFFDPASSENPADIDKHHRRELKRATMFIEYVLEVRQNRHLPIIFVQTHLDQWANDAIVRDKAECWANDVHTRLVESYGSGLKRLHPKSIVDRSRTAFSISSVGETEEADKQLAKIIEQLNELVADSAAYRRRLRRSGLYPLVASVGVLAVLLFIIWFLSSMGGAGNSSGGGRIVVAEMREREILAQLEELDRMLKAHPPDRQLPSVKEATDLNNHLRWLTQRLWPDSGGFAGLPEGTKQRMRATLDSVAGLVQEKADIEGLSLAELTPVVAAYLKDLPDLAPVSAPLAAAQARYWQLQRAQAIEQVGGILKRRDDVGSPPIETLGELVSKLRNIEQEVGRSKVFGDRARQGLVQEIKTTATFCEDTKKSNSSSLTFRVISASDSSNKPADLAWRNLTITSPTQKDWLSKDGVALIPRNNEIRVDLQPTVVWGRKCRSGYANSVKLLIDGVQLWEQKVTSAPNRRSVLNAQRITRKRGDKLDVAAHIRITDGTFPISSREHGRGELSVKVGELLEKEQMIVLDTYENNVELTATRADGERATEFGTKELKYRARFGLGSPVTCVLSLYNDTEGKWRKLHEFDLTTEQGPLAPLGLPLLRPDQPVVTKVLQWEGMELKLEFSDFPPVPRLLLDAAANAKERKP